MRSLLKRRPRLTVVRDDGAAVRAADWTLRGLIVGGVAIASAIGWLVFHAR